MASLKLLEEDVSWQKASGSDTEMLTVPFALAMM